MQQPQAVTHVVQCHTVPRHTGSGGYGIGHLDDHHRAAPPGGNTHRGARAAGLHTVAHGVLHQRLQQQRRQPGLAGLRVDGPFLLQAFAETHLFDRQITPGQRDLLAQGYRLALVHQRMAEQIAQVLQQRFGLGRLGAYQRNRAVERIEQKMRTDARLQFRQTCGGGGRSAAFGAQHQRGHQGGRQRRAGTGTCHPWRLLHQAHHDQHGAAIHAGQCTQQQSRSILPPLWQPGKPVLEAARHNQPDQRGGQGRTGQHRQAQQPIPSAGGIEHRTDPHHHFYKQQRPQYHAGLAGIEYQHPFRLRRRRLRVQFGKGR